MNRTDVSKRFIKLGYIGKLRKLMFNRACVT